VPIDKNQTFTFDDVPLGRFRVSVVPASSNSDWIIESVIVNERESVDSGFEVKGEPITGVAIRITNRPARIRGMLSDGKDQPITNYRVTVFSTDSSRWSFPSRYVGSATTGRDGRYVIENVASGDYFVLAQQDFELDDAAMFEMFVEASHTAPRGLRLVASASKYST